MSVSWGVEMQQSVILEQFYGAISLASCFVLFKLSFMEGGRHPPPMCIIPSCQLVISFCGGCSGYSTIDAVDLFAWSRYSIIFEAANLFIWSRYSDTLYTSPPFSSYNSAIKVILEGATLTTTSFESEISWMKVPSPMAPEIHSVIIGRGWLWFEERSLFDEIGLLYAILLCAIQYVHILGCGYNQSRATMATISFEGVNKGGPSLQWPVQLLTVEMIGKYLSILCATVYIIQVTR